MHVVCACGLLHCSSRGSKNIGYCRHGTRPTRPGPSYLNALRLPLVEIVRYSRRPQDPRFSVAGKPISSGAFRRVYFRKLQLRDFVYSIALYREFFILDQLSLQTRQLDLRLTPVCQCVKADYRILTFHAKNLSWFFTEVDSGRSILAMSVPTAKRTIIGQFTRRTVETKNPHGPGHYVLALTSLITFSRVP